MFDFIRDIVIGTIENVTNSFGVISEATGGVLSGTIENTGNIIGGTMNNIGVPLGNEIINIFKFGGDNINDIFLTQASYFWLIGAIPRGTYKSITNQGQTTNQQEEELYLGDINNIFSIANQAALTTFIPVSIGLSFINELFSSNVTLINNEDTRNPIMNRRFVNERWFFINGISVDDNWLFKNCIHLEDRFNQPVTGIHNRSYGVIVDIFESFSHRNIMIATRAVNDVMTIVNNALNENQNVRLIAHSQGTIILRIALDILHQRRPNDMNRLMIHTFASAAKDFPDHGYLVLEHYANQNDVVAKLGVLNGRYRSRYQGIIYENNGDTGHLFNMFYSLHSNDYFPITTATSLFSL